MELFDQYPVLHNDRIILRKMTEDDACALEELTADENVYRTLPTFLYELKYTDKREVITKMDEECFDTCESVLLGVYLKAGGGQSERLVGIAEIYNYEKNKAKASIGYRIAEKYWGRGIASDVTGLLKQYLIGDLGFRTITAHVLSTNAASARVLGKNGFINKYPGLLEDWGFDELMVTDKYAYKRDWTEGLDEQDKKPEVRVEQYVMAYGIEQDRIRALLPEGYRSLRPVLRINAEIRNDKILYVEFNTPVEADGRRGWLNIDNWKSTNDDICYERDGSRVVITAPFLRISFAGTGIRGGCPAEQDNEGCYYVRNDLEFRPAEKIEEPKEFCDCEFAWHFGEGDAYGVSEGRTIPATDTPAQTKYEKNELTAQNAAAIPCKQVLGSYKVTFIRK